MDTLTLSSLLLLLSLLSSVLASTVTVDQLNDDPLIKQVVSSSDVEESEDHLLNADHHFSLFKSKFSKNYATQEEHDYRFRVFKSNLRRANRRQLLDPTAVHGVTKFSDLTPSEFRSQFLGLNRRLRLPADAQKAPILPTNDLPTDFDWRDHGAVTGVKDQRPLMCKRCREEKEEDDIQPRINQTIKDEEESIMRLGHYRKFIK